MEDDMAEAVHPGDPEVSLLADVLWALGSLGVGDARRHAMAVVEAMRASPQMFSR